MGLEGPRPTVVQAWPQVPGDDPTEPQPRPEFAGLDHEETAAEPQKPYDGDRDGFEPHQSEGNSDEARRSVADPDPFWRNGRAAHAEDEKSQEQQGTDILDRLRQERRCRAEGRQRIEAPSP